MKTAIRFLFPLAASVVAAKAIPFLAVSDSAELFATGTFGARYDDNVLLSEHEQRDTVFHANPGLVFEYGRGTESTGYIGAQGDFDFYRQTPKLNTALSSFMLGGVFDNKDTRISLDASFRQLAYATFELRQPLLAADAVLTRGLFVRRDVLDAALAMESAVSERSRLGGGVSHRSIDYRRAGYVDQHVTTVPIEYFYRMADEVDASLTLRYRNNHLRDLPGSNDYYVGMGARGSFTERLHGSFSVGYVLRDYKAGDRDGTVGASADLQYRLSTMLQVAATFSNDFETLASGQSLRRMSPGLVVTGKLSNDWTLSLGGSYNQLNYLRQAKRADDYVEGSLDVAYSVNSVLTLSGSYVYRTLDSRLSGYDFTNNVISLNAKLRY